MLPDADPVCVIVSKMSKSKTRQHKSIFSVEDVIGFYVKSVLHVTYHMASASRR